MLPQRVYKGDQIRFMESLANYPASAYTLRYELSSLAENRTINGQADGDDFIIDVSTSAWELGDYQWIKRVEAISDNAVTTLEDGRLRLLDPQPTGEDIRSFPERALEIVEAELLARTSGVISSSIDTTSVQHMSDRDLNNYRKDLQAEISKEKRKLDAEMGKTSRNVFVRMP